MAIRRAREKPFTKEAQWYKNQNKMSYQHFRLELLPCKSFVFGSMWRVRSTDVFKIKRIEGGGDEGGSGTRTSVLLVTQLDCKQSVFLRIQVRASSQTKGLEWGWNRERDWVFFLSPHTPVGRVRLARFARVRLLHHALPISLLILRKKTDCFAV